MSARAITFAALATASLVAASCGAARTAPPDPDDQRTLPSANSGLLCSSNVVTPGGARDDGKGPRVVRVMIRGVTGPRALCDLLTTKAGAPLDPESVSRDIREIWKTGFVDDVLAAKEDAPGGIVLSFALVGRKEVTRVALEGAPKNASTEALEADLPGAGFVDPKRRWHAQRDLIATLRGMGYRHAEAESRIDEDPAGGASLVFKVTPGKPTLVGEVKLSGASVLDPKRTLEGLATRADQPVSDLAFERDVLVIAAAGYDAGLIQIHVDPPTVVDSADGARATVTFPIAEGPVFHVGKVKFSGELRGTSEDYVKRFNAPKKGDVFRRSDFTGVIAAVTSFHATKGESVSVEPRTDVDLTKHTIDMELAVSVARPTP